VGRRIARPVRITVFVAVLALLCSACGGDPRRGDDRILRLPPG
jgi:hypothetical protein